MEKKSARIAVVADSHDNLTLIKKAVAVIREGRADAIFHGGDFVAPFTAAGFRRADVPLYGVYGNNDGDRAALRRAYAPWGTLSPDPFRFDFRGFRILLTHKPRLAREAAATPGYDLIAFGHDHHVRVECGDALVLCPGELCGWVTGRASIALVELGLSDVDIVYL